MPKTNNSRGRVKVPVAAVHPDTLEALSKLRAEKKISWGQAIDLVWENLIETRRDLLDAQRRLNKLEKAAQ